MSQTLPKTLFAGVGTSPLTWYRCALPATVLGCDWAGIAGKPPHVKVLTGNTSMQELDATGYDVVVLELVRGPEWLAQIRSWQERGITVLYEIDDWLRGIRKLEHHSFKDDFDRATVESYELCMRAADGVICSTPWLADRYRRVNPRTWACRNGIDLPRYAYDRPERDVVGIGWAGGTGHLAAARPWMVHAVAPVMAERPDTRFISVGAPFGHTFAKKFGADRALTVPFLPMEAYPAAMTHFDVAIAPAGQGGFYQGKSDLRWLEASALGLPTIADPRVYPEIEHGVTGFHASTPAAAREILRELVDDRELRASVGEAARAYVAEHRSAAATATDWAHVLSELAAPRPAQTAAA
jgi:glycosyltransferase involved in cell wall biosynthesis